MINISKIFKQDASGSPRLILPLLPLRDIVVFPHMVVPLFVGRAKSVNALADAMNRDKCVFLATQNKPGIDNPRERDINRVGTIGNVLQLLRLPDNTVKSLVEGKSRGRIISFKTEEQFFQVEVEPIIEQSVIEVESDALVRAVLDEFKEYAKVNKNISKELINTISAIVNPSQLCDTIASHFGFKIPDKQKLLEMPVLTNRLALLIKLIRNEVEIFSVGQKIKGRVRSQIEKSQKNYYLSEQMRAIKKELGTDEIGNDEIKELQKKIKRKKMPKEVVAKVKYEFEKLKMMAPMSSEATVVRNYIDWLISMPWYDQVKLNHNLDKAEKILNEDHYGLEKPKERILEFLAVQILVKKIRGPILCFVGPPGVGKTSLAKSVARATGRKFVRISLGGVRDEAEIRGHRRTYIGAMPGKIIQSIKKVSVNNPVFCLDEVDKMSTDFRGDPSSALLEVLDPEQNSAFNDHYLDVDVDLSDILFITTANMLQDIPLPLQDRMEIIRIPGYTEYEKFEIAKNFIIPKQIKSNGLEQTKLYFSKKAIMSIIQHYTREAGVRNLEREIATICRKVAREIIQKSTDTPENPTLENPVNLTYADEEFENDVEHQHDVIKIPSTSLIKYLGQPRFRIGQIEKEDMVGLVTGLAWTQVGGEILNIETVIIPGKGDLIITGKLGDVMKESAQAAVSYVRSRSKRLKIDPVFYQKYDIHVHVPEGAIPKDGPSAGIAICTSIVSVLTRRPVDRNIAMTGEITLRGRVLPIGGLRDKILAAHRGGITKIIIPKENENDLKEIPSSISKLLEIVTVEHMDEVLTDAIILRSSEDRLFDENETGDYGFILEHTVIPQIDEHLVPLPENITTH
ncbi:MAG: endopeptidase La [Desulfobacterales bacterium]|nr:endopeptidase La [Desulfobacterales bacterium]